jgi:hypothetical protein
MTANARGRLRFGANPHHRAGCPALNLRRRRGDQYGLPFVSSDRSASMNPWDLIGLAGIIVVVAILLVFGRSLRGSSAPRRIGAWEDSWPVDGRPMAGLPRIPLSRRDVL